MGVLLQIAFVASSVLEPRCSIATRFPGPTPEVAIVLARATGETVSSRAPVRTRFDYTDRDTTAVLVGYRFEVLSIAGGTGELSAGDTFTVVPWEYGPSCEPVIWSERRYVPVRAESVFYFSQGRAPAGGVEPILDVRGWHEPYPQAEFLKFAARRARAPTDRTEWLTAPELFAMLSRLPDMFPANTVDRAAWREQVERVFRDGDPRWTVTFPGTAVLAWTQHWASN